MRTCGKCRLQRSHLICARFGARHQVVAGLRKRAKVQASRLLMAVWCENVAITMSLGYRLKGRIHSLSVSRDRFALLLRAIFLALFLLLDPASWHPFMSEF